MIVICARSGLAFEADSKRKKVHPAIRHYTSHKDTNIRYPAIAVIEQGKKEGWDSLEKFQAEIKKALNPPLTPPVEYDFEGYWAAKITGYSKQYDYEREFLTPVEEVGRFRRYRLTEEGCYQTCYRSAKGNETRIFWQVTGGVLEEISPEQLESVLGKRIDVEKPERGELIETKRLLGDIGETVQFNARWVTITAVEMIALYRDEETGITSTYYPEDSSEVIEIETYRTWVEPATAEQVAECQAIDKIKAYATKAVIELKEIDSTEQWEKPEQANPQGLKISLRDKTLGYDSSYLQVDRSARLLWRVVYNNRDGDLWSMNNLDGHSIAKCRPLTPELEAELDTIAESIKVIYPEAVDAEGSVSE